VYAFFSGCFVLDGEGKLKDLALMYKVKEGKRFRRPPVRQMPEFFWNLVTRCWSQNPIKRPYFGEIVEELRKHRNEYKFWKEVDLDEVEEYEERILSAGEEVYWVPYERRIEKRKAQRQSLD
jgi:hypothetical protein